MTCAAPDQGGPEPAAGGAPGEVVVTGRVRRDGATAAGAYVRLLDDAGEFVAEVVSGPDGRFRFFVVPGSWTVRALVAGAHGTRGVDARAGRVEADVDLVAEPG